MEDQHFVPKTYLKHFCKNKEQELYAVKFIEAAKKWSSPRARNINSICYQGDYYNLDEAKADYHSVEKDHIERNAFWYEKEYYNQLIQQVFNGEVDSDIIDELPHFFLNMKARNPVFRKSYSKKNIKKAFDKVLPNFKEKYSWIDESFLDKIIDKNKDEFIKVEDGGKKLHNNSLLKTTLGSNKTFKDVLEKVSKYNLVFYKISTEDEYFITSDSPGFSVGIDGNVHTIKFKDDMYHFMPLHPKLAVGLMNPIHYNSPERVSLVQATKDQVRQLNFGTTITRTNYLIGFDNVHLKTHTQEISSNSN